jgi:hypothetical protein
MNCPSEVAAVLLDILEMGILRVRAVGWSGDPARCAIEADHIHNLPRLLSDYSPERLRYYWVAERPGFVAQTHSQGLKSFEPLWQRLGELMEKLDPGSAGGR